MSAAYWPFRLVESTIFGIVLVISCHFGNIGIRPYFKPWYWIFYIISKGNIVIKEINES